MCEQANLLSPEHRDRPAETAQSPSLFQNQRLDQTLAFPKNSEGFICRGSREQPGKYLEPEAPSTLPAAPSSILFILHQGVLVRESKLPLFLQVQLPISPSSENCSVHGRSSN